MSWWDSSSFSNFATSALKNAQKKIDKVLDIQEEDGGGATSSVSEVKTAEKNSAHVVTTTEFTEKQKEQKSSGSKNKSFSEFDNFWNNWFDTDAKQQPPSSSLAPSTKSPTKKTSAKQDKDISSANTMAVKRSDSQSSTEVKPSVAEKRLLAKKGPLKLVSISKQTSKSDESTEDGKAQSQSSDDKAKPMQCERVQVEVIPVTTANAVEFADSTLDESGQSEVSTETVSSAGDKSSEKYAEVTVKSNTGGEDCEFSKLHYEDSLSSDEEKMKAEVRSEDSNETRMESDVCVSSSDTIQDALEVTSNEMEKSPGSEVNNRQSDESVRDELDSCAIVNVSTDDSVSVELETTLCESTNTSKLDSSTDSVTVTPIVNEGGIEESMMSSVSSESYVKCSVDGTDASKHEDNDSNSSSEPSDLVKVESGQTSGDEIDTTTSSDIEIISNPTPTSEIHRPFDFSPFRQALQHSVHVSGGSHRRTDSSDSSGRYGDAGSLSPGSNGEDSHAEQTPRPKASAFKPVSPRQPLEVKVEDPNDPMNPQKLLKLSQSENNGDLAKKLAEMAEILEAREKKLVLLSKENLDLQECRSILRNQLEQAEEAHGAEMADLTQLTEEFTKRIAEAERKLNQTLKDKEALKKQLSTAQEELTKTVSGSSSIQKMLKEKDEQIGELLSEGEKLSKQQLQSNNIIKKLRVKEKDNEAVIKTQKEKLETQKTEIDHLKTVLDSKDEVEIKHRDAINQLNAAVKKQEKEILKLKSELEDAVEKSRSMQVALDNSYKEIAELHKQNAAYDSKAQEASLSAEVQAKEELRLSLDKYRHQTEKEKESLLAQVDDLHLSLSRLERDSNRREDMLKQEIKDLQLRLQEADGRNDELTQSVTAATRPLLRQIENLQSTYGVQSSSWERVEKNMTDRLSEAQTQLAAAIEKERDSSEQLMELKSRVTALDSQTATLRQEKSRLTAELQMERSKLEHLEDSKNREAVQLEVVNSNLTKEVTVLKKDKVLLQTELDMERLKLETERKKVSIAHEQLMEKEMQLAAQIPAPGGPRTSSSMPGPLDRMAVSGYERRLSTEGRKSESPMSLSMSASQDEILERTLMLASSNGSKTNLYDSLRQASGAPLLESLESQLKQKEGEIVQLQSEISELERTRESMAKELVTMQTKIDSMEVELSDLPAFKAKYQELEQRYDALLQMYGEKVEETDELRLDLQDVKDMYKQQIEELIRRST